MKTWAAAREVKNQLLCSEIFEPAVEILPGIKAFIDPPNPKELSIIWLF